MKKLVVLFLNLVFSVVISPIGNDKFPYSNLNAAISNNPVAVDFSYLIGVYSDEPSVSIIASNHLLKIHGERKDGLHIYPRFNNHYYISITNSAKVEYEDAMLNIPDGLSDEQRYYLFYIDGNSSLFLCNTDILQLVEKTSSASVIYVGINSNLDVDTTVVKNICFAHDGSVVIGENQLLFGNNKFVNITAQKQSEDGTIYTPSIFYIVSDISKKKLMFENRNDINVIVNLGGYSISSSVQSCGANAPQLLFDVYVSSYGSDVPDCGSSNTPCLTLDYAVTQAVSDVAPVTFYLGGAVPVSTVRLVTADYTLQQFNTDDKPDTDVLIAAASTQPNSIVIDVVDVSLAISGLVVEDTPSDSGAAVISVSGTKPDLKASNSTFRYSDSARLTTRILIKVSSGIVTIDDCVFRDFQRLLAVSLIVVTEDVRQFHIGGSAFSDIGSVPIVDSSASGVVNVYVGSVPGTRLDVQASNFTNTSTLSSGGGLFVVHLKSTDNSVVVNNSVFVHTTAIDGSGGAIYYYKDDCDPALSTYLFTYITFLDCTAGYRGQHLFFRGYDFAHIITPANFYGSYEPTEDDRYLWGWTVVNGELQEGSLLYYLNRQILPDDE